MKIDYSEFIARHHKTTQPDLLQAPVKQSHDGLWTLFSLLFFVAALLVLAAVSYMHGALDLPSATAFVLVGVGGVLAFRSYRMHARRSGEMNLVHSVLEGSRAARVITDGGDNTVYYNRNFERLCRGVGAPGYPTLVRLFQNNEEALSHFNMLAEKAQRGLTDSIDLFSKYEDQERWLTVTAQPIAGYAGYVHWRVDDVTESYTADSAIREEREKLIDFTDNAPVGFFSVNEEGRFVFANATFARWVGEDLQILLDQGCLHTYMVDPPQEGQPYDLTDKGGLRQVVEVEMKGSGGQTFLAAINQAIVQEPGGHVRTRAVVHDLTTERKMRAALKESEARFQRFFEEAPLGIILADGLHFL